MSADSASEIVGHLNQGDYLPLVTSIDGWHEVDISGGATGFISADWTVVLAEPPEPVTKDDTGEAENVGGETTVEEVEAAAVPTGQIEADVAEAAVAEVPEAEVSDEVAPETERSPDAESDAGPDDEMVPQVLEELAGEAGTAGKEEEIPVEVVAAPEVEEVTVEVTEEAAEVVAEEAAATVEQLTEEASEIVPDSMADSAVEKVVVETDDDAEEAVVPAGSVAVAVPGPQGPPGPPGPAGAASIEGSVGFLTRFTAPTIGGSSQVFDDGNNIGIGTTEPKQRLEVNGNIQIHERNSSVAGLMITQSDGETGYIMHNRASTLTIGAGSVDRITIDRNGNVGIGVSRPSNPIEMASGAHVTAGGVWTNSSSRARKENIAELSLDDALSTLTQLEPVQFNYKNDKSEHYVGFIAEDVPDLVATSDRDGLSSMDIVAVLTRVVQEQQKKIEELEARLDSQ
jgi:hypothetical protein